MIEQLFLCLGLIVIGAMMFLAGTSSCAGRDICGKRFCFVGLMSDYMMIPSLILILIGLIGLIYLSITTIFIPFAVQFI